MEEDVKLAVSGAAEIKTLNKGVDYGLDTAN